MKAVVVGRGRWGHRIAAMLEREGHDAQMLSLRPAEDEDRTGFAARVARTLDDAAGGAELVWLAVPPTAPQAALVEGVLASRRHVVVEKPWWVDARRTAKLAAKAARHDLIAAVHFQLCYLDEWAALAGQFNAAEAEFRGVFTTARPTRHDMPAMDNLGTHLLAVRRFWFPEATLAELHTAYEGADRRAIELSRQGQTRRVDFTTTDQPIVERFLADLRRRAAAGGAFPLDLTFAAEVQGELAAFLGRSRPAPDPEAGT